MGRMDYDKENGDLGDRYVHEVEVVGWKESLIASIADEYYQQGNGES